MSDTPKPNRMQDDGSPCWCIEWKGEHTPRCLTLRALTGGYDFTKPGSTGGQRRAPQRLQKAAWLRAFSKTGIIQSACDEVGVDRTTVLRWKNDDEAFAREWGKAYDAAIDGLEREAMRRAFEGWEEPVYQGGAMVGTIRKFSDTLLIFLMKGARPGKYRDNARIELTGADGGPVQTQAVDSLDDHEKRRLRQLIDDALAQQERVEAENA